MNLGRRQAGRVGTPRARVPSYRLARPAGIRLPAGTSRSTRQSDCRLLPAVTKQSASRPPARHPLPAGTKSQPKRDAPRLDKPAIQYWSRRAVRAGIEDICIVRAARSAPSRTTSTATSSSSTCWPARARRERDEVGPSPTWPTSTTSARGAAGLGHAVSVARRHVGDHPFVVLRLHEFMAEVSGLLEGMIATYDQHAARARPDGGGGDEIAPTAAPTPSRLANRLGEGERRGREAKAGGGPSTWPSWGLRA